MELNIHNRTTTTAIVIMGIMLGVIGISATTLITDTSVETDKLNGSLAWGNITGAPMEATANYTNSSTYSYYSNLIGFINESNTSKYVDCVDIGQAASDLCTLTDTDTTCAGSGQCTNVLYGDNESSLNVNGSSFCDYEGLYNYQNHTNSTEFSPCSGIWGATSNLCTLTDTDTVCSGSGQCSSILYDANRSAISVNASAYTNWTGILDKPANIIGNYTGTAFTVPADGSVDHDAFGNYSGTCFTITDAGSVDHDSFGNYTDAAINTIDHWVNTTGDSMTGNLTTTAPIVIQGNLTVFEFRDSYGNIRYREYINDTGWHIRESVVPYD